MFSVTSLTTRFSRDRIHLSSCSNFSGRTHRSMVRFIITNRLAFQILLAKLRMASHRSGRKRISLPGAFPVTRLKRSASAPYCSATSSGSMPLPRDLDILRPFSSRTRPWMSTVWKGGLPVCSQAEKIIRATQKKMMS